MDSKFKKGIFTALILGLFAYLFDYLLDSNSIFSPGSSTIAFILGVITASFVSGLNLGGKYTIDNILPIAIIFLGFGLNLGLLIKPEIGLLGVLVIFTVALVSFSSSYFFGKLFGLDLESSVALGAGGAICGNSAVIAVSPSLKMKEEQVAIVLATINILGLFTFILIPIMSNFLGLSQQDAGVWAGAVVHAVPQTIAAGEAIGSEGLIIATLLKLCRVTLLILVVPLCAIIGQRNGLRDFEVSKKVKLPYFIPGFLIAAFFCTWVLPESASNVLFSLGKLLLLPVMASVGYFINWTNFKSSAYPVLSVGLITTFLMILAVFGLINLF